MEIIAEVIADLFEENFALKIPPVEVGLIESFVGDKLFAGDVLPKARKRGIGEADGKASKTSGSVV